MTERWREIPDFPGYEASDLGRIRSVDRDIMGLRRGELVKIRRRGVVLRPKTHARTGYVSAELAGRDVLVHRAVLAAFIGPCPEGHEGAHGDGVRQNDVLTNLRYATRAENHADKIAHGTAVRGESVHAAKLTEQAVLDIRASRDGTTVLADLHGVSRTTIKHIRRRQTWRHI